MTTATHLELPITGMTCASCANRVEHKLKAYTLDLLGEHSCDFVITVAEFNGERFDRLCEFHARETFRQREVSSVQLPPWMKMNFGSIASCSIMARSA